MNTTINSSTPSTFSELGFKDNSKPVLQRPDSRGESYGYWELQHAPTAFQKECVYLSKYTSKGEKVFYIHLESFADLTELMNDLDDLVSWR